MKEYESGVAKLDERNRLLVQFVNDLAARVRDGADTGEQLHTTINKIFEYCSTHFADEEQMMNDLGVDRRHIDQHHTEHQRFIGQFISIWDARHTVSMPGVVLLEFLHAWLRLHFLDMDQSLGRQMERIQGGIRGDEAFVEDEIQVPQTSLRGAARRVRQILFEHNEALARSNQILESQLLERTRELENVTQRLEMISRQDGVLGIANRTYFDERLKTECRLGRRHKHTVSLLIVDVDHLRGFNDAYGHLSGDNCLRSVAQAVRDQLFRPTDLVARYGGEEIAALLPSTDIEGARVVADRIQSRIAELSIPNTASPVSARVTVSIGVAAIDPEAGGDSFSLLIQVEKALLEAKRRGRNQTFLYRDSANLTLAKG